MAKIDYRLLFEALQNSAEKYSIARATEKKSIQFLTNAVLKKLSLEDAILDDEAFNDLESRILGFASTLKTKWLGANYSLKTFLTKNSDWLDREFEWTPAPIKSTENSKASQPRGRPLKDFNELSERAKQKRTADLRAATTTDELVSATISSLNIAGKRAAADIVAQATQFSPERPIRMRQMIEKKEEDQQPVPYTPEEALALCRDLRFTKDQYILLRKLARKRNADIYPPYRLLLEAKKRLNPKGVQIDQNPEGVQIDQNPEGGQIDQNPEGVQIDQNPEGVQIDQNPESESSEESS